MSILSLLFHKYSNCFTCRDLRKEKRYEYLGIFNECCKKRENLKSFDETGILWSCQQCARLFKRVMK